MFHSPYSHSTAFPVKSTEWPFVTNNDPAGWYEVVDSGTALTQEGFRIRLGQVALGQASWTEGDDQSILDRGIVADPEDQDPTNEAPLLNIGNYSGFGSVKEILLNPVPPSDANLHGHWTADSFDVNDTRDGFLVRDVSGRNNHALFNAFFYNYIGSPANQSRFYAQPFSTIDPDTPVSAAITDGKDPSTNDYVLNEIFQESHGGIGLLEASFQDHDPAEDVINVSGNRSIRLMGRADDFNAGEGRDADGVTQVYGPPEKGGGRWITSLILASNGTVYGTDSTYQSKLATAYSSHQYKGNPYPVDLTDSQTGQKFNKQTLCFWWKPPTNIGMNYDDYNICGQELITPSSGGTYKGWALRLLRPRYWQYELAADGKAVSIIDPHTIYHSDATSLWDGYRIGTISYPQVPIESGGPFGYYVPPRGSQHANAHTYPPATANNEFPLYWWHSHNDYIVMHDPPDESGNRLYSNTAIISDDDRLGWKGPTDGVYAPIKPGEWHFITVQTNFEDGTQTLWVYREGVGLLYQRTRNLHVSLKTDGFINSDLVLGGAGNYGWQDWSGGGALQQEVNQSLKAGFPSGPSGGNFDEIRLYNSILSPRNIRYLYENPTGRARQLQPRPGMAAKTNHETFYGGYPQETQSSWTILGRRINAFAYFHGFDVDGNPADLDPYVSHDGVVKYLKKGFIHTHFGTAARRQQYEGNTFYIIYNDPPLVSGYSYYSACQPVGNDSVRFPNNPDKHTWRRLGVSDWVYFTPDDETQLIVGEGRFANSIESGGHLGGALDIKNLKVYQFSRNAESIRESYNFNIRREDFFESEGMGNHFFANALFWTGDQGRGLLNGTHIETLSVKNSAIKDLAVEKLQAGTIGVSVKIGGENKIELDAPNNRIIIRD